jgi:predicted Fe-Mo cluster-binding NifX family protein
MDDLRQTRIKSKGNLKMNVCIPITEDQGLQSPVSAHFGSAPLFMIVDTESGARRTVPNHNSHHGHGMCQPLSALAGEQIDGMIVGGIGMRALSKLHALGIQAFLSEYPTVAEAVAALEAGTLEPVTDDTACAQHHGAEHETGHHR